MIDFEAGTLSFQGKPLPIEKWTVYFMTPFGLIDNFTEAVLKCQENDMIPQQVIVPVPVAIDQAGRYEIVARG